MRNATVVDWISAGDDAMRAIASDVAAFRARRRATPLLPYECLDPIAWHLLPDFRERLERRLTGGFTLGPHTLPSLVDPIDWPAQVRPFALHLDAWEPISELLMGHSLHGEARYLAAALAFARGWLAAVHAESLAIGPDPIALDAAFGPMRWFDMSVGQRVYRLAYIVDVAARDASVGDAELLQMTGSLVFHHQLLSRDDFHRGHNNHGFFQALGELASARRFRDEPFFAARHGAALERTRDATARQFHESGMHREHSPGYHLMVLGSLIGARASGLFDDDAVAGLIDASEEALSWLVQPGGMLLTFGDTDPRAIGSGRHPAAMFRHTGLRFYASAGAEGKPPPPGLRLYQEDGYVLARSSPPGPGRGGWWYLAQMAAFQSRVHKHADDLSVVWSDGGSQILIDPGGFGRAKRSQKDSELARLGFWYEGEERVYVESTRAHNTVEIDGRSYDRKRKPYGSALRYAGEQDGVIVTECEIVQFAAVRHWRLLVFSPGRFLLVVDRLHDRDGRPHDYRQHFHFHPDWESAGDPTVAGAPLLLRDARSERRLALLSCTPSPSPPRAVRGRGEPERLGWYSDKAWSLKPCTAVTVERLQTASADFATLLSLDPSVSLDAKRTKVRHSMRPSVVCWRTGGRTVTVTIERGETHCPPVVRVEG